MPHIDVLWEGYHLDAASQVGEQSMTIKKNLYYGSIPVLTYTIHYPQFSSGIFPIAVWKINEYYLEKALKEQQYFEHCLYREAVKTYRDMIENGFPFHAFEAVSTYTLTYQENCTLSLYFDQYEFTGGAHGNTVRHSDTWSLESASRIPLQYLFGGYDPEKIGVPLVNKQIAEQIEAGTGQYFENYQELTAEYFNTNSFYLTPQGIVIYYQQYEIAPYSSGIPTFTIPFYAASNMQPQCS